MIDRVTFEPAQPRENLFAIYRSADALVFPVEWPEPFGLVPIEAMALGRPVIATGQGGSGDYLVDRSNSLLFKPGDATALAAAVKLLASDASLRETVRNRAFQTASEHGEDRFNRGAVREMEAAATKR